MQARALGWRAADRESRKFREQVSTHCTVQTPYARIGRLRRRSDEMLLIGSYVVAATASVVILGLTGVMTFIAGRIAGTHISLGLVIAGSMGVWSLALIFAGISALASAVLHGSKTVTGIALAVLVAMYALDVAGRLADGLEPLRWVSAFRYYGAPLRDGIDPASFFGRRRRSAPPHTWRRTDRPTRHSPLTRSTGWSETQRRGSCEPPTAAVFSRGVRAGR